jgi:hypothetical protein
MTYDNTNRGAIFENDRKENDNHPDMKGQINVEGAEFWVSGWWKEDRNGNEYMSLSVNPKQPQQRQAQQPQGTRQQPQQPRQPQRTHQQMKRGESAPKSATGFDDMDDDIPF